MDTYNGSKSIQEQLQSFVDQTLQPDEPTITDDGSTDQTEAIVHEFAKTAPSTVEFHRNEKNLGYCGNFKAALTYGKLAAQTHGASIDGRKAGLMKYRPQCSG